MPSKNLVTVYKDFKKEKEISAERLQPARGLLSHV